LPELRRDLAGLLFNLADYLGRRRDWEPMMELLDRAWQAAEELPETAEVQELRSGILTDRGLALAHRGRDAEARGVFEQAERLLAALPAELANDPGVEARRARVAFSLALLSVKKLNYGEAKPHYERAEAIQKRLVETYGGNALFRREYVQTLVNHGLLIWQLSLSAGNDLSAAETRLRKAVEQGQRLIAETSQPELHFDLALAEYHLASFVSSQRNLQESLELLTFASDRLGNLRVAVDSHGEADALLLMVLAARARLCLDLKDHAQAFASIQAAEPLAPKQADEFFHAAVFAATCAALAEADVDLSETEHAALVEKYSAHAVVLLGRAMEYGLRDARRIGQTPELEPLKSRDDFRRLLEQIGASKK
jgi:tetratricopeptide (TPR) repeat protein